MQDVNVPPLVLGYQRSSPLVQTSTPMSGRLEGKSQGSVEYIVHCRHGQHSKSQQQFTHKMYGFL